MNTLSPQLGLCVKKLDHEVLSQNEACITTCGDMQGKVCDKGCMSSYTMAQSNASNINEGMTLIKNSVVDTSVVDAVVINDGKTITTIIYSLEDKIKNIDQSLDQLKKLGLTKSEIAIFTHVMKGLKNSEISKKLFISKATIKTHLNNIYKKLPVEWHKFKNRH